MNTQLYPGNVDKAPYSYFVVIASVSALLAITMFVSVIGYARWRKII